MMVYCKQRFDAWVCPNMRHAPSFGHSNLGFWDPFRSMTNGASADIGRSAFGTPWYLMSD